MARFVASRAGRWGLGTAGLASVGAAGYFAAQQRQHPQAQRGISHRPESGSRFRWWAAPSAALAEDTQAERPSCSPSVDGKLCRDNQLFRPQCDIKRMTRADIEELVDKGRIVVCFKGAVYDVTEFTGHPGGYGRLQLAAGMDLEPYWEVLTQHNRGHIYEFMQRYKVGELSAEDSQAIREATVYSNPYVNDPEPSPDLLTNTRHPYNAEAPLRRLTDSFVTPIGKHFVRNHCHVPDIDPNEYELVVKGVGLREMRFSLQDLKSKFEKHSVTTVIQCNGNRREDTHYVKEDTPAFGPPHWVAGAIGNATWSGARLRDVLKAAGMDVDAIALRMKDAPEGAVNIGMKGMDMDELGNQYCASFPFEKAIDPFGDCLIAYEMNGVDIPREHGYPVRMVVPGHAGARNCKYLGEVQVTPSPCIGDGNWKQYAVHAPDVPLEKIMEFEEHAFELKKDPAVQEMPVQSLITNPGAFDILPGTKTVKVTGFAWGGGGAGLNRVDVSVDGGKTFTRANLIEREVKQRRRSEWSWQFFEKEISLPEEMQKRLDAGEKVELDLVSKALNTAWNVQPERIEPNYNAHGCCVNHWYHVPVTLDPKATSVTLGGTPDEFVNKPSGGSFKTPFRNFDQPPVLEE